MALNLITSWLPVVWDLSAATAPGSQEKAIAYMTCREAAASAAAGPPSTSSAPSTRVLSAGQSGYDLAVSVIKVHQPTKLPAKVSEQPDVSEQLIDVPPPEQGGSVDGEIAVTTTVVITPPFLLGAYFGKNGISLSSKHVAPFTYVIPKVPQSP